MYTDVFRPLGAIIIITLANITTNVANEISKKNSLGMGFQQTNYRGAYISGSRYDEYELEEIEVCRNPTEFVFYYRNIASEKMSIGM